MGKGKGAPVKHWVNGLGQPIPAPKHKPRKMHEIGLNELHEMRIKNEALSEARATVKASLRKLGDSPETRALAAAIDSLEIAWQGAFLIEFMIGERYQVKPREDRAKGARAAAASKRKKALDKIREHDPGPTAGGYTKRRHKIVQKIMEQDSVSYEAAESTIPPRIDSHLKEIDAESFGAAFDHDQGEDDGTAK